MRSLFVILFVVIAVSPVVAQDADFDLQAEIELCATCHGETGTPVDSSYPIIWGQEYYYIYVQLRDYAAARRDHEIMTPIAAEYSRDEAKLLAEYFAAQEWPSIQAAQEDGDADIANVAISGGQCSACHGKWNGDSRIPRLAGQQPEYVAQTLKDFKSDTRMNSPDKNSTMKKFDDPTIEAVARHLSAL